MIRGINVIHLHHKNESFSPAAHSCHTFHLEFSNQICAFKCHHQTRDGGLLNGLKCRGLLPRATPPVSSWLLHIKTLGLTDYSSCRRHHTACEKLDEHHKSRKPSLNALWHTHWGVLYIQYHCQKWLTHYVYLYKSSDLIL